MRTSCGHRYCAHCIAGVRDCPSCGADIEAVDPDPATQSTVETFLDTHAGEVSLWELEGTAHGAAGLPPPGDGRDAASFLLQVALRALAAGNLPSALARLGKCKERLEAQLANARQTPNPPYATDSVPYSGNNNREESGPSDDVPARLGAVCGCLGDCARAAGDAATALEHYQDSAGYLREAASDNDDAAQALSVTLNKIAEVHHAQGDVAAALPFYLESLDLRKARYKQYSTNVSNCIGGNTGVSAECIGAALDVAMGEAKVADALEAGADAQQAQQHLAAGKEILGTLEKCMEAAPEGLRRKHAMLVAHFDQATK